MKQRPVKLHSIKYNANRAMQSQIQRNMQDRLDRNRYEEEKRRMLSGRADVQMKDLRDQFQKAEDMVEKLKDKVDGKRGRNNTVRVGSIAAMGAGALATTMTALQGENGLDEGLRYLIAMGASIGAAIMNSYFQENDVKLHEVLNRINDLKTGELLPEDVNNFKQIYKQVKKEFAADKTFNGIIRQNSSAYNRYVWFNMRYFSYRSSYSMG